jgi:hypothetical protein
MPRKTPASVFKKLTTEYDAVLALRNGNFLVLQGFAPDLLVRVYGEDGDIMEAVTWDDQEIMEDPLFVIESIFGEARAV